MGKIKNFMTSEKNYGLVVPIISIVGAFLVASIIMIITGLDAGKTFSSIVKGISGMDLDKIGAKNFFNARLLGEFLVESMPIILTGLSVAFAFRTGLFNIGAEGQLMMGALGAVSVGLLLDLPMIIHLPLAILAAIVMGALWGAIPGLLKAKFRVHEVVVCIMLNYVSLQFVKMVMKALPGANSNQTPPVNAGASLASDFLKDISSNSRLHWGFIFVILALFIFYYVIERTSFGYELRAVGFNKDGARYAGIKVEKNIVLSMMISGGFSGLAGAMITLGTFGYGRVLSEFEGYGFDGIAVALVGGNTALGTLFGGLIFGGLSNSGRILQLNRIPLEITMIISALIVLFIAMRHGFEDLLRMWGSNKSMGIPQGYVESAEAVVAANKSKDADKGGK